jgi:hypothetical protein
MRIHSSHFIYPSLHVLNLSANPLHHSHSRLCHFPNHLGTLSAMASEFVSRGLLAFSEQCEMDLERQPIPIRLINPHQIISRMMNNVVLLLSFGLCSPVLCCYTALGICAHLCCWLFLIGRFVCLRTDALQSTASPSGSFFLPSSSRSL